MTVRAKNNRPLSRRAIAFTAMVFALLAVISVLMVTGKKPKEEPPAETVTVDEPVDTIKPVTVDTVRPVVTEKKKIARKPTPAKKITPADTARPDTTAVTPDTAAKETAAVIGATSKKCGQDTLMPWVYPDPSGGLHQGPVTIRFKANKQCVISWQLASQEQWHEYDGGPIVIRESDAVLYKAADSCGNEMATREELYDIEPEKSTSACPQNMDLVVIGDMRFCIDRYEWPNRKGAVPIAYVSLYQAADSCFSRGKRLCTSEEWSLACSGPYSWNFPYGQAYEPYACVTSDTALRPSGSKPECRAYFGTFDMAGNLAEWTSTPAKQDRNFNNVVGGFWESGLRSGCFEKRYSYYPQNRHNPVGFRCCAESKGQ